MKLLILFLTSFPLFAVDMNFRTRVWQKSEYYIYEDTVAENKFGKNLAARILGTYPLYENERAQKYINAVGAAVAAVVGRSDIEYRFAIIKDEDINAYALPGGYIFITLGALKLIENEAELVGVLGHEIAHVNNRHVVKKLKIVGGKGGLGSAMGAVIGAPTQAARKVMENLVDQGFKLLYEEGLHKDDEAQSDLESVQTMVALGYCTKSYLMFLKRLGEKLEEKNLKVLSKTHPPLKSRIILMVNHLKGEEFSLKEGLINQKRFVKYVKL